MRILGLDVGDKRIGIAISDENEIISVPLEVIKNDEFLFFAEFGGDFGDFDASSMDENRLVFLKQSLEVAD